MFNRKIIKKNRVDDERTMLVLHEKVIFIFNFSKDIKFSTNLHAG